MTDRLDERHGFKRKLEAGASPTVLWVSIPWPPLVEIAADAGYDAVLVDMQHSTLELADVDRFVLAGRAASISVLVRPRRVDRFEISALLDIGADGIVFPDIRSAADARYARSCMRYAPDGRRDWGGSHTRSADWAGASAAVSVSHPTARDGVYSPGYVARTNAELISIYLIGSDEGVANLAEIMDAGGPDAMVFAAGQFSLESSFDSTAVEAARERFSRGCAARSIPAAGGVGGAASAGDSRRGFVIAGHDVLLVRNALHEALSRSSSS